MPDDFQPVFKALSEATQELIRTNSVLVAANQHLLAIGEALTRADASASSTTASQHARDEGEDVKETVRRLERLIEELIRRQGGPS